MSATPVVYVVDDEPTMCTSLTRLLSSADLVSKSFASAQDFLQENFIERPTCLLLDVNLAADSGFDVQSELMRRGLHFPIIFMTGYGTIPMSVRAIKAGAHEFLTKPFEPDYLLDLIGQALEQDRGNLIRRLETESCRRRFDTLTPREREVMALAITGKMIKQIAHELGTSEITAKVHKRHLMTKMQARTLIDLVKMADRLNAVE
ncbi:FixJ family two-component response regulator [Pseudomonas sp. JUb42]|jgi:FixJ family two-component response regulator|uniref:response regulator transcription factor n=1 Tax=Pseudomonas sp. JUb42 TaxID=2940611 RepID=UPI0021698604|nr:response regulator [Pseudomonas sp. JUb42]MCS3471845.1 FixJ family two-component response regulator [Pseudomonas sp. JUb42]